MMTNKQRAYLSSLASKENAIFQIGKSSLTTEIISAVDEALAKRELIKISVFLSTIAYKFHFTHFLYLSGN